MGKNGFWWYIRTCHSQFSAFWSIICQNWLKIVVFTTFSFDFNYNYSNKNSTTKIPEKLICSQKLHVGVSWIFACGSEFTKKWQLVNATFGWFRFEHPFLHFFHFFELTKKVFFRLFSKWVTFAALIMEILLKRFLTCGLMN